MFILKESDKGDKGEMVKMAEDVKVPEGWRRVRLGNIGKIVSGSTPNTTNPNFWNGDIVWITPDDLSKLKTMYVSTSSRKLTKEGLRSSSAKLIPPYSIVLSSRAPIGYIAISTVPYATNQGCKSIIPHESYNPKFLYYCLQRYIKKMVALSSGTTFTEISKSQLEKLNVILPLSLPEQRKIAEILETIDNAIEKTDKIIEKYKRIKQGLMQELLTKGIDENGQIRSEETHRFKDSPLGRIPEEWEVVELEEVTNQIIDGTHHTPTYIKDGIPFLRVTDIQKNDINLDNVMKIDPKEHKILSKRCKPEYGDILYSKNGTIGISKVVEWTWEFSIFVSLCLIKPKHEVVYNKFLKYFLDTELIRKQIMYRAKQLSITNLHLEEIREFLIPLPPLPEQKRIASILSQIDETIEKEQKYKEKLERIKRGLMEDLLTGKVRVNKLIEGVENVPQA